MIPDDDHISNTQIWAQTASGIGDNHAADTKSSKQAHRKRNLQQSQSQWTRQMVHFQRGRLI